MRAQGPTEFLHRAISIQLGDFGPQPEPHCGPTVGLPWGLGPVERHNCQSANCSTKFRNGVVVTGSIHSASSSNYRLSCFALRWLLCDLSSDRYRRLQAPQKLQAGSAVLALSVQIESKNGSGMVLDGFRARASSEYAIRTYKVCRIVIGKLRNVSINNAVSGSCSGTV